MCGFSLIWLVKTTERIIYLIEKRYLNQCFQMQYVVAIDA